MEVSSQVKPQTKDEWKEIGGRLFKPQSTYFPQREKKTQTFQKTRIFVLCIIRDDLYKWLIVANVEMLITNESWRRNQLKI